MSDITLLLGPVVFHDFEVPARINIGGIQRLALHRLVGGARVIDLLGRDDAEIRFEGVFSGSDATLRARTLDELRASGMTLPLTWDVFYYTVLVTQFEAEYRTSWWIPFRIACTVLRDEAAALISTAVTLVDSVAADITAAVSAAGGAGLDLSATQSALGLPNATIFGASAYAGAQASLGSAQTSISQGITSAEGALNDAGLASASSASAGIEGLGAATSAAQQLAALTVARGYVARAAVNLSNAST